MPSRQVLWLVPLLLAVHNAEEALFFPRYLPLVLARTASRVAGRGRPAHDRAGVSALAVVTGVAFAIAWWAHRRPDSRAALWLLLLIQSAVLLNAAGTRGPRSSSSADTRPAWSRPWA